MRVLHLITGLETGGAETILYRLLSQIDRTHFQAAVVSLTRQGMLGKKIAALGVPVHCLGMRGRFPNPLAMVILERIARRFCPDVIQGWMYHGNLAAEFVAFWKCPHTAVVWNIRQSLHCLQEEKFTTAALISLGAKLSLRPQKIIYNAQRSAEQHEMLGYQREKRMIIPNGFDICAFRASRQARIEIRRELGLGEQELLIGLIARWHPVKDHESFLSAAAALRLNAHFLLVGKAVDANNHELKRLIDKLCLHYKVHLLGERRDMARVTAALDLATSASCAEGFPNAIGEAMSCQVPCVVTDVGDSPVLVGQTGAVVPPKKPQALANAWNHLLTMKERDRLDLGKKARARIAKHYSLEQMTNRYQALYLSLA